MNARILLPLISAMVLSEAPAAQSLETPYRTAGQAMHQTFEPVRKVLQTSSAVIRRGRREIIFGTVVSPEGHILTKATELGEMDGLTVTVDRTAYSNPVLLAESPEWDLALIKIDAEGLVPVHFPTIDELPQGTWVVANGATTRSMRRVQIGVVAANEREVFAMGGTVLGVALKSDGDRLTVEEVSPGSGAEEAGMKAGDKLVSIDGKPLKDRDELMERLKNRRVGEHLRVGVSRGGETIDLSIELSARVIEEQSRNDVMSGEYSERRTGFPRVMQHDIMGNRHTMGGPVFNLDGECVGMNIARFSRCETYAIPAAELSKLASEMIARAK